MRFASPLIVVSLATSLAACSKVSAPGPRDDHGPLSSRDPALQAISEGELTSLARDPTTLEAAVTGGTIAAPAFARIVARGFRKE